MAVRRTHHGDLDTLLRESSDAPCPLSFDRRSPFELEAELGEERDSGIEGFHHDADVVHPRKRHAAHCSSCSRLDTSAGRVRTACAEADELRVAERSNSQIKSYVATG